MKAKDSQVVWCPRRWTGSRGGEIDVIPLGRSGRHLDDRERWPCWDPIVGHSATKWQVLATMLVRFHTCVVRDGITPKAAHRAFLKIEEYRRFISADISGADP